MPDLPPRPDLDQLRRQARDLLRAARAGDPDATARIRAVSSSLTLTSARLAIAREYGFPGWARLKTEAEARTRDLAEQAAAFCEASIRDWTGRAARMLAATPEIAGYGLATAVVLGDADRVREAIGHDPAAATRPDPRTGWTPLHAACASRWHYLDPARAQGLTAVARLLLDAGADPAASIRGPRGGTWTPLRCAVAGAANPAIVRLLLERGAVPGDHDLYLACFGGDGSESLRLLLARSPDVSQSTALSAPVSTGDTEAVRLLLEAGADPNRPLPRDDGEPAWPALYAAISSGCPAELAGLLLARGADPAAAGPDGRSPYRLATSLGRVDLTALLRRHGARDDATGTELFVAACLRGERAAAHRMLAGDPGMLARLTAAERGAILVAAERGDTGAVQLMLDLGFDAGTRGGDDGGTALHAAAYSGSASTARLLLDRGAGIEARDTTWDSTPLVWAMVGSGERPRHNPRPDWTATVQTLLEAVASTAGIELSPDDAKAPSPEVAGILRAAGVPDRHHTPTG
ncbi:MAG: ankyrin repeat domain-containing protein [Trebonia sp.]